MATENKQFQIRVAILIKAILIDNNRRNNNRDNDNAVTKMAT